LVEKEGDEEIGEEEEINSEEEQAETNIQLQKEKRDISLSQDLQIETIISDSV
jgi:hypothetical protein